ncbi:PAS domain S-box-containing protein [Haladaptatus litoreus]|uniref:PAS domain S-box-containing protein n=1 Tax=Haladaptatus litoreus TaxID=553468 RepID=A0A1N7E5V6_9EURY|nr:bacterio-opsin activator domain-containing protein [Haladaptatus litoreus]SIR83388.1 PAS domain S-box-containing protein [Haladaptatus litoreus]
MDTADQTRTARQAVERLADPVVAFDTDWQVTYLNDPARDIFGFGIGERLPEALPTTAGETMHERCQASIADGDSCSFWLSLGDTQYEATTHPDEDGVTLVFQECDVLEDVAAELQLKERAINEAPVGITIADAQPNDEPLIYVNEAFEELTGYDSEDVLGQNCRFLQGEDSDPDAVAEMRTAIDNEEPVSVELCNYRNDGEKFWNRVDIAPIRDDAGEVTHYGGFQTDITERKDAEFAARRRAKEREHLLERIEGLLGDVTSAVVEAPTRTAIETAVCERVSSVEPYNFAWVGERDIRTDSVEVRAVAGDCDPKPDHPLVIDALETGELQVDELGVEGCEAVAALPIAYDDTEYGVLVICATRQDAFDEREQVVLRSLGRAIASAINARETRRILIADSVVEAEFAFRSADLFFVDIAKQTGADIEYLQSTNRDDGSVVSFFSVRGASPDDVIAAVEDRESVTEARLVAENDGEALFEFVLPSGTLVSTMSEYGGKTQAISATPNDSRVVVEFPQEADVRGLVERLKQSYPGTELLAYRHRERPAKTRQDFIENLTENLTERQLTALQTAYVSGFFDWPRPVTGEELAESMQISRSTFHEHLRAAERKLCGEFFGDEPV